MEESMRRLLAHWTYAFLVTFTLIQSKAWTSADAFLFAQFPNAYFVETGTYTGDGVQMALDAGFQKVYSIELDPELFLHTRKRFLHNEKVKMVAGDSAKKLKDVLLDIQAPATFWLDAHFAGDGTAKGKVRTPILDELEQIRQHHIKTHTILVDDVRQFGTEDFEFVSIKEVKAKILKINRNYQFRYLDGFVPNDILVAYVPEDFQGVYQESDESDSYDSIDTDSDDDAFIQNELKNSSTSVSDDDFSEHESLQSSESSEDVLPSQSSESESLGEKSSTSDSSSSRSHDRSICDHKSRDSEGRSIRD